MHYLGGKQRIAKHIISYLNKFTDKYNTLYEPFVGACNIGIYTNFQKIYCFDIHEDLILMWQALQNDWKPPKEFSELQYNSLKFAEVSALRGFIGFGASFSGKWFGGYARDSTGRNYIANAANSINKKTLANNFYSAKFSCINYLEHDWSNVKNCVFYNDPPYLNTTRYKHKFNHEKFWQITRELSKNNLVFTSEYNAPNDFERVLEIPTKTDLRTKNGQEVRIERLFTLK